MLTLLLVWLTDIVMAVQLANALLVVILLQRAAVGLYYVCRWFWSYYLHLGGLVD